MIVYESDNELARRLIDSKYSRRFLAEGDSWFSIGGLTSNLLDVIDRDDWLIVSCAYPGDTLRNMADMCNGPFLRLLDERYGCKWDGVLLSAGGNDLIGRCWEVVNHLGVDWGRLSNFLDGIAADIGAVLKNIRHNGHACPVYVHCYDWPTPKENGWLELGPWMGPQFHAVSLPQSEWSLTAKSLIDAYANWLKTLANDHFGLHVVDARGKAEKADWHSWNPFMHRGDWRNEIHLTTGGYRKHAAAWHAVISETLGETNHGQQELF